MKKGKLFFSTFSLVFALLISACRSPSESDDSSLSSSSASMSETSEDTSTSLSSVETVDDYNEFLNSFSQAGHLYIHYNRPDAPIYEYNQYCVWIWQMSPKNQEGTLWGASDTYVRWLLTPMSTSWMKLDGDEIHVDQHGAIMDIDMTRTDLLSGKNELPVSFEGATKVGFLIVLQSSMDGGTHWTSDGGADVIINNFDELWDDRDNGSIHLFCTKGAVSSYTFEADDEAPVNPTVDDTTGMYRSSADVESSKTINGVPPTSESFKDLGVGYQIFVPSFRDSNGDGMGDIRGIINSLDYLDDLGVSVLWLTPIQESSSYHGYDVTDFYKVDPRFGTLEDYRELIFKAHQKGMKVLMDLVLNHTSKNNIWFTLSQRAEVGTDIHGNEINYRDLYHWKYKGDLVRYYDGHIDDSNGSLTVVEDEGYKMIPVEEHPDWYRDGESNYYYFGKFGSGMAELNYDSQTTRDFVIQMAQYWLSFGLDGFRLDAVKHIYMYDEVDYQNGDIIISDLSGKRSYNDEMMEYEVKLNDYSSNLTKNINFWKEFSYGVKRIYPDCFLVGENFDGYGHRIAPYYQALDSQFDFSLYYHNNEWLYGETTAAGMSTGQPLETYEAFKGNGQNGIYVNGAVAYSVPEGNRSDFINSPFTSNHDVNRAINHVNGDKSKITGTSVEFGRAVVHAASTILSPGISWIYYGDELGMSSNTDTHIALYDNENNMDIWYRQPFKWGDDTETDVTFNIYEITYDSYNENLRSEIEQSQSDTDGDMLDIYKQLIQIKNEFGEVESYQGYYTNDNTDILRYDLTCENGVFRIYINSGLNNTNHTTTLSGSQIWRINGTYSNTIPPYGIAVVKV